MKQPSFTRSRRAAAVLRHALSFLALLLLALRGLAAGAERPGSGAVHQLTIDGVINPLTARYLERGLQEAARARAEVVVVRLDTPGGLESSMRQMTRMLLSSPVPVVVYVAPPGARAASAGMFLTIAAHVAAMAPGTNIGAAHPVGIGGQNDKVMAAKVTNDAAALARALAAQRGRNAEWAERAVRESVSITAGEALKQDVIDLVAADLPQLLRRLDGRQVVTTSGATTLHTAAAPVTERPMTLLERILLTLIDPNIAYLLMSLGTIGIIAELYHPGSLFPGISGVIALILAFTAFGSLPINWAGVVLLLLAVALFVAELHTQGIGFLAVGGTVAFVLGSLMLFSPFQPISPAMPAVQVSPWLIGATTAGIAGFFLLVLRSAIHATRSPVVTGIQALIGRIGVALSDLAPLGRVRVAGEVWTAVSETGPIPAGEAVEVVGVEGVTLRVIRRSEDV
jgi:membrane-bound serine protease (ClpP class)